MNFRQEKDAVFFELAFAHAADPRQSAQIGRARRGKLKQCLIVKDHIGCEAMRAGKMQAQRLQSLENGGIVAA